MAPDWHGLDWSIQRKQEDVAIYISGETSFAACTERGFNSTVNVKCQKVSVMNGTTRNVNKFQTSFLKTNVVNLFVLGAANAQ